MTDIIYKITDQNMTTFNDFQWKLGEWYETSGKGDLCGSGWLHCYTDPLLAVFLNPIHADIENPRLFRGEGEGRMKDDRGLKRGYTRMRILEELPLPEITSEHRVKFAILCALSVYHHPTFTAWAKKWLSGEDRSQGTAEKAAWAIESEWITGPEAGVAADAAWAAWHATWAAGSSRVAAMAAADAARVRDIDLIAIAHEALK